MKHRLITTSQVFPSSPGAMRSPKPFFLLLKIYGDMAASMYKGLCPRKEDLSAQNTGVCHGPYEVTFSYPCLKHLLSVIP